MNARSQSPMSAFKRRPLISAVKGLIAGTFLGGCRLGMQQPPPMPPANAPSDAGSATVAPVETQARVDTAGGGDGGTDAR